MRELIDAIIKRASTVENDSLLLGKEYIIDTSLFADLPEGHHKEVTFVDGGNLEIIKSPALSLFFNRIYASTYLANTRISSKKVEFFSLFYPEGNVFKTDYFFVGAGLDLKKYSFSKTHKKLFAMKTSISVLGDIIRRLAELKMASLFSGFVVLDGSLECKIPEEEELLSKNLFGLSKTTEILTKNGKSASASLSNISDKDNWLYRCDNTLFLKLHRNSSYIFRLDIQEDIELNTLLFVLMENSKDPAFPGYPYGLIHADKMAQVTEREKTRLQLELLLRVKEEKIWPLIASMNAHELLNRL